MPLTLKKLKYFLATAETGQVSLAATELNVSQTAVTAAIKSLERTFECKLFDRHSNGVTLTFQGQELRRRAQVVDTAVQEVTESLQTNSGTVKGSVKLGISYTVAGYFLPPILSQLCRTFPSIDIELFELNRAEVEQQLINDDIDLGIILVGNIKHHELLESTILVRSQRRLWTHSAHPMRRKSVTLSDIANEPYLMLTVDEAEQSALRYWARTSNMPNVVFRTSSVEAVRSMVARNMGVTILSDMVYRPWSLDGARIEATSIRDKVDPMNVGLAWKKGVEPSPPVKSIVDLLKDQFVERSTWINEV